MLTRTYVIISAKGSDVGCELRAASDAEKAAYLAQPCRHPAFRKPVRIGDILVDEVVTGLPMVDQTAPLCW